MTQQHPITPPPELVQQWIDALYGPPEDASSYDKALATLAAQWGADQELEACLDQLQRWGIQGVDNLRNTRRPKPPSKQEALDELYISFDRGYLKKEAADIIRRALEQLPDSE